MHTLYIPSVRYCLWLEIRLCCLRTQKLHYIEHRMRRSWSMATIVNIMVQVQGYTCYTLFNILCIITHNIIIINSHNKILGNIKRWSGDDISYKHIIKTAYGHDSWRAMIANVCTRHATQWWWPIVQRWLSHAQSFKFKLTSPYNNLNIAITSACNLCFLNSTLHIVKRSVTS